MTYSWHYRPCCDIIGFPYIRRRAWPIEWTYLTWGLGFTSVLSLTTGYSCMLGLTRWRMSPFLEPTSFNCIWLGCYYCKRPLCVDAPENTSTHPVSVILNTLRAICTGLTSFWLVPVCTIHRVVVYISGSVSPPRWHIIFLCGTHHNFWHPWVAPNWSRMARFVEGIPPWLKPKSASVWSDKTKRDTLFHIRRVGRLDWEDVYLATCS